jgi:hypothetical protein
LTPLPELQVNLVAFAVGPDRGAMKQGPNHAPERGVNHDLHQGEPAKETDTRDLVAITPGTTS